MPLEHGSEIAVHHEETGIVLNLTISNLHETYWSIRILVLC